MDQEPIVFTPLNETIREVDRVPNVPLMSKVLDHIEAHPEEWEQSLWAGPKQLPRDSRGRFVERAGTACGTAFCFAGHAVVMTGHELDWQTNYKGQPYADYTTDGKPISEVAAEELGLSLGNARVMFNASNNLSALWAYAEEFTNGEIKRPG